MLTMPEPTTSLSAPPSLLPWLLCLASWCTLHPSFVFFTPILGLAAVLPILLFIVLLHYLGPLLLPCSQERISCLLWDGENDSVVKHLYHMHEDWDSTTWETRQVDLCTFKARLIHIVRSRSARPTQGDPVST